MNSSQTNQTAIQLMTLPQISRRCRIAITTAWRRYNASGISPDAVILADGGGVNVPLFLKLREHEVSKIITTKTKVQ